MGQYRDTILLHGGEAAGVVWSDHGDEGAIHTSHAWFHGSTDATMRAAKVAASNRAGRPGMAWVFVVGKS